MLNETKLIYYIEEHPINFIQSNVIPTPSGNTKSNKVKLTPLSHIHVQWFLNSRSFTVGIA
jgi:hypothetical protein